jgi:hypothetical protein
VIGGPRSGGRRRRDLVDQGGVAEGPGLGLELAELGLQAGRLVVQGREVPADPVTVGDAGGASAVAELGQLSDQALGGRGAGQVGVEHRGPVVAEHVLVEEPADGSGCHARGGAPPLATGPVARGV